MTSELADLDAPTADGEQVDEIILAFEKALNELEEDPASALSPGAEPFEPADELSNRYGIKSCSEV